jgi:hypothetical protein
LGIRVRVARGDYPGNEKLGIILVAARILITAAGISVLGIRALVARGG